MSAETPETITEAELAEALDSFWLTVAGEGRRVHGQVADPGEVASVLLATLGRIAAERSPDGPQGDSPGTVPDDTRRDSPASVVDAGARTGVVAGDAADDHWRRKAEPVTVTEPALPVAAALDPDPEMARLRAVAAGGAREVRRAIDEAVRAEMDRAVAAEARLLELENAVTWNTSCTSCARVLDSACAETVRREQAEGKLAAARSCAEDWKLLIGDGDGTDLADAILAITGSEGAAPDMPAGLSAFWLVTDEDGDIILNGPCADTLGCLWSSSHTGERVTLGDLLASAGTHAGMAAGELHARLAVVAGYADEGPPNNGRPVIHSGAVAPGGWVCAVPVPGNPDQICGMPVESEPCTDHGQGGSEGESDA